MKKRKQADLLLRERQGRRPRRPLSFLRKHWPDIAISVLIYAAFVNYIGWFVPSGIGTLIATIAWAVSQEEER